MTPNPVVKELLLLFASDNMMAVSKQSKSNLEHNQTRDNCFHCSDDDEEPATSNLHNHTSIEVLQYLEDSSSSLESLQGFPKVKKVFTKLTRHLLRLH